MSLEPRISLKRRVAAVLVVLALILVSFASVSTRFHSHPGHSHPHSCQHHPPHPDGDADHGLPTRSTADSPDGSCGLCLFLAGCPAPESVVPPALISPEAIAWIRSGRTLPTRVTGALRPPERGPPTQA